MATVINEAKIKELAKIEGTMKATFEEFLLENTLATKKSIISSAKKARSLSGQLGKMMKEYRKISLAAFDKDAKTKAKMKKKREERKAAGGSKTKAKKTTVVKKKK